MCRNKESSIGIGVNKESSTGIGDNKESSTGIGDNKESSTGIGDNKESSTGIGDNKESSTGICDNKESSTGICDNKESSTSIGDNKESSTGIGDNKESSIGIGVNKESCTDMCYNKETAAERHSGLCRKSVSVSPIRIRPHHGMCLAFFKGHGYSSGFSRHMQEMLEIFETDPAIILQVDTDEICSFCPNNQNGICSSSGLVAAYDEAILETCGMEEGAEMSFLKFAEKVEREIISPGKRREICGNCQWNDICSTQASRWKHLPT